MPRSLTPWVVVVTLTAAGAAAAAGYGLTAPKRYRATAELLVAPVPASDPTYTGLDVLRDSGAKGAAAASAAALLRSPQVADVVRARLGLTRSRDALLSELHASVAPGSNVVRVTVEDTSATGAAQVANAFADALVSQRTASYQSQLVSAIRREQHLLAAIPPRQQSSPAATVIAQRLAVLQGLQGQPDPTLRHAAQATAPVSASWPHVPRLVATGAVVGLALGIVAALLLLLFRGVRPLEAVGAAGYDRAVSDRLAARLEQRLTQRVDALVAEQERLAAREAALAVRERDVSEKLEELRAVQAAAPAPAPAPPPPPVDEGREEALAQRERELEARVAALSLRERELARRAAAVAVRERELAELAAAPPPPPPPPEPEPKPEPRPEPRPEPEAPAAAAEAPPPEPAAAGDGVSRRYNLVQLERLVQERGGAFPDRLDEWSAYLFFLRDYAYPDGTVPATFDWLIADTFAELVEA